MSVLREETFFTKLQTLQNKRTFASQDKRGLNHASILSFCGKDIREKEQIIRAKKCREKKCLFV